MKKIFSVFLSLVMLCGMLLVGSLTALAANPLPITPQYNASVGTSGYAVTVTTADELIAVGNALDAYLASEYFKNVSSVTVILDSSSNDNDLVLNSVTPFAYDWGKMSLYLYQSSGYAYSSLIIGKNVDLTIGYYNSSSGRLLRVDGKLTVNRDYSNYRRATVNGTLNVKGNLNTNDITIAAGGILNLYTLPVTTSSIGCEVINSGRVNTPTGALTFDEPDKFTLTDTSGSYGVVLPDNADRLTSAGDKAEIDVNGIYVDGATAPVSYSVDISWGAMEFSYEKSGEKNWKPEDHSYEDNTVTEWKASGNTVMVTNHSNAKVSASLSYAPETGYEGIIGAFDNANLALPSAVEKATNSPELSQNASLTLSGTIGNAQTTLVKVGKITVTLC